MWMDRMCLARRGACVEGAFVNETDRRINEMYLKIVVKESLVKLRA